MKDLQQRLSKGVEVLDTLERRRTETKSPALGADTERDLIDRELREIEADILEDPGALERFLVRRRDNWTA